jgi:hypothetical protein
MMVVGTDLLVWIVTARSSCMEILEFFKGRWKTRRTSGVILVNLLENEKTKKNQYKSRKLSKKLEHNIYLVFSITLQIFNYN